MRAERDGDVVVVTFEEPDQKLNEASLTALGAQLEDVEATEGPLALVLAGEGKTFHQGLDLEYVGGLGPRFDGFIRRVHRLFGRLLRLDVPTVAAVTGHAIAAGAMIATSCDLRIMRADRGWFRTPEVELQLPFTIVMNDLLAGRLPQPARHRLMVLGERMGGAEAVAAGVVDEAVEGEAATLERAVERAAELSRYRGRSLQRIRTALYADLLAEIAADEHRSDLQVR